MIVCVTDQSGNKVTVLRSSIPIERPGDLNLLIELAGAHNRHCNGDAVLQGGCDPGVVAASGSSGNTNALRIDVGAREQVPERTLRLILRDTLLRKTH